LSNDDNAGVGDADTPLWRQFAAASTQEAFCSSWLALQCRFVAGVCGGVVLLRDPEQGRPFAPVAFWPDRQSDLRHLAAVAERAIAERRGVVVERDAPSPSASSEARPRYDVAYPIQVADQVFGVVALDLDWRPERQLHDVLRQLQWGCGWIEVLSHRRASAQESWPAQRLQAVVETLATMGGHERFKGAAFALVTALGTRFACDRVSLGFVHGGEVEVQALSHSAEVDADTNLLRAITAAMEETIDQHTTINYPTASHEAGVVTRAHEELARRYHNGSICSIPLTAHGRVVGAITLERPADRPFEQGTLDVCESVVQLAGPALETQRRDDRWLIGKITDAGREQIEHLIGPRHVALKLSTAGLVLAVIFFAVFKTEYRVSAKTVIEPMTRRAIVAAFNGYVAEAPARAGDVVKSGQVLSQLDDRELRLERSKWASQEEQSRKQYYEALGLRNAPQVQILTAQLDQARAQVALIDDQLSRTREVAPFDGVIVSGDLSQSLGSPVERGQVLFEVAPLDAYRIVLQVDERDIADVALGQQGRIVLSGFPQQPLPFTVSLLTPVSTASEGRNYFRVEATLPTLPERLRPGMEGVGKIDVDRRRLIWIWTHDVVDWVRLRLWRWLP
jgi:RND family efflux transporter MFP subunit